MHIDSLTVRGIHCLDFVLARREDLKQSRDFALPLVEVGIKRISITVKSDEAEARLPRRGDDNGREAGEDTRSSDLVPVFIANYSDASLEAKG